MFGYVTINQDEIKIKDYKTYRAYYCGLCKRLGKQYGVRGKVLLTFDMTFLGLLLSSLYESQDELKLQRCVLHPSKKELIAENEMLDYAADMNVLLAYHNLMDDWFDDHNAAKLTLARMIHKKYKETAVRYPRQRRAIQRYMKRMHECEVRKEKNLDVAAGLTGTVLKELFIYKKDEWKEPLGQMGFYLGKFIYLMDAYEDVEKDKKAGNYNPLIPMMKDSDFTEKCKDMMMLMMAECSRAFETLPILENVDILRNILYSGVWVKYEKVTKERAGNKNDNGSI